MRVEPAAQSVRRFRETGCGVALGNQEFADEVGLILLVVPTSGLPRDQAARERHDHRLARLPLTSDLNRSGGFPNRAASRSRDRSGRLSVLSPTMRAKYARVSQSV